MTTQAKFKAALKLCDIKFYFFPDSKYFIKRVHPGEIALTATDKDVLDFVEYALKGESERKFDEEAGEYLKINFSENY